MKAAALLFTMLVSVSLISCSNNMADSAENSFRYYSKGYLIPFEMKISVTGNDLALFYKGSKMNKAFEENFTIKDDENKRLFDFLNEINFLKMDVPKPERLRDTPMKKLFASIEGESREIDIGQISSVPESLMKLQTRIFNLATAYKPEWKKDIGWE